MDPARTCKTELRTALKQAMLLKQRDEAALLRSLIAAIDNAEAIGLDPDRSASMDLLAEAPSEAKRRNLSAADIDAIFAKEAAERRIAARDYRIAGQDPRAEALESEARLIERGWGHYSR